MTGLGKTLNEVYNVMEGSEAMRAYSKRHGIDSAAVLTVTDDKLADAIAGYLADRIEGKTVIEIGGGIGLLALHLGNIAKRVYCIEANPIWAQSFAGLLLAKKPRNVSYLFGTADEFLGQIKGDVALFCTHSDVKGMARVASQFAPVVIDVYGELIKARPEAFDAAARTLRNLV